jgi:hypothetical protein
MSELKPQVGDLVRWTEMRGLTVDTSRGDPMRLDICRWDGSFAPAPISHKNFVSPPWRWAHDEATPIMIAAAMRIFLVTINASPAPLPTAHLPYEWPMKRAVCKCDIKDLMSTGHTSGCPEKRR